MIYRFTLSHTTGNLVLPRDPEGWDDIVSVIKRDPEYHGLFYEFEDRKLDFYCGNGKEYIETIYDSEGIDAEIGILIEFSCNGSSYSTYFEGRLNLKTFRSSGFSEREFIEVGIDNAGDLMQIMNRLETVVSLSDSTSIDGTALTALSPTEITLHSKAIQKRTYVQVFENITASEGVDPNFADGDTVHLFPPFYPEISDLTGGNTITDNFVKCNTGYGTCSAYPVQEFIEAVEDVIVDFRLKFTVRFKRNPALPGAQLDITAFNVYIVLGTSIASPESVYSVTPGIVDMSSSDYDITFDVSGSREYVGSAGDKFYAFFVVNTASGITMEFTIDILSDSLTYIDIKGQTFYTTTTCNAFPVFETGKRIAQSITSVEDSFKSDYFGRTSLGYASNGCGALAGITNGFQIRGFPIADRPIRVSMKDYFNSLNAIHNLGLGYENSKLTIEPKEYFYENTLLFTLDNVPNIEMSIPQRLYYANFEFNYEKWENEEVNGLDEFNTRRQYSTGVKSIDNLLRVTSKLIASGYAIEFTRRKQYSESFTEDDKFDNDNFIIALNSAFSAAEKNENFPYVENLISPETAYNLRFSPARNTMRWSNVLKSNLIKPLSSINPKSLKFTYGEGNYEMVSVQDDDCNDYIIGTVAGSELTNDPEFDSNGIWYHAGAVITEYTFTSGSVNVATYSGTGNRNLYSGEVCVIGQTYRAEIVVVSGTGGFYSGSKVQDLTAGSYTIDFTAGGTRAGFVTSSATDFTVSLLSVKRVLSGVLYENADLEYAGLKTPIWIPEEYKFEYPLTFAQYEAIRTNPKGYIQFSNSESGHIKGFIIEAKYRRDTGMTTFTLLRKYD